MVTACARCACNSLDGARVHALVALLVADDLDAALAQGLLERHCCPDCASGCNQLVGKARSARLSALAARDRHRARERRLQRRNAEREAARIPKPAVASAPALPAAAADVLARALAKARMPR